LKIHFYDQKFALYRHKVYNPTIKRFYSFDETFAFLYGKHYVVKRDLHFWQDKITLKYSQLCVSSLKRLIMT